MKLIVFMMILIKSKNRRIMLQEVYSKAIDDFVSIMEQVKAERQKNIQSGKYVNVFSLWNNFSGISEPIHSRILQFFLSAGIGHTHCIRQAQAKTAARELYAFLKVFLGMSNNITAILFKVFKQFF